MLERIAAVALSALLALPAVAAEPPAPETLLEGPEAFDNWETSAPGVRRLIRPEDLPEPFETEDTSNAPQTTEMPSGALPIVGDGFTVEMVVSGMDTPRVIRAAPNGDLFVADSGANEIHVLRLAEGGDTAEPTEHEVFADGLNQPYGIAFHPPGPDPEWVYVANTDSVVRFPYSEGDLSAAGEPETVVDILPTGRHWTRDLAFSPDGERLFVSVGSGSNVAEQVDDEPEGGIEAFAAESPLGAMWGEEQNRAVVLSFAADGTDKQTHATGLRNCSGLTVQPAGGDLWCVVNERDGLGDNVPPDFATRVEVGAFYGWPWFYIGGNEDPRDVIPGERPDLVDQVTVPDVLFQSHSAPLGIVFYDGDMFPADYRGDAFVTFHGSWNRGNRTGYKVVRVIFDESGEPTGEYEDFMTGFVISAAQVWGRPVGVAVGTDGALYVTEDGNGTIWRVTSTRGSS